MNFGTDQGEIDSIAEKLEAAATSVEETINSIYSQIDGLNGNGWSGGGYDAFSAECNAYKDALSQIPGVLRDFANFFNNTGRPHSEQLHSAVETAFNTIKGA